MTRPRLPLLEARRSPLLSALVITACFLPQSRADVPPSASLPRIFNGRDFSGWKLPAEPYWRIVDGVLVGESDTAKKGSMLYTEASYGDVIVEADVRFSGEIDSGIMVRRPELQVQIGVSRSLKRDMTCSFYTGSYPESARADRARELLKPDTWNTIRVAAKGDTFTVWLNGEKVSQYTDAKYKDPGPIGLQIHGGLVMKVEFRNLRALRLDETTSAASVAVDPAEATAANDGTHSPSAVGGAMAGCPAALESACQPGPLRSAPCPPRSRHTRRWRWRL